MAGSPGLSRPFRRADLNRLPPSSLRLPDELESIRGAACAACDRGEPELAKDKMAAALELAHDLHWF